MTTGSRAREITFARKLRRLFVTLVPILLGLWVAVIGLLLKVFGA